MSKNILITGAAGMLGKAISKKYPLADKLHGRSDLDLANKHLVQEWFKDRNYSTIIHCAANTSRLSCEDHPKKAFELHSGIVPILNEHSSRLIYISTVPIWIREKCSDVYFISKKEGENNALLREGNIVLRTNIFGPANLSHWAITNLTKNMDIQGYVNSYFNPVHVAQLSEEIVKIVNKETKPEGGIYSVFGNRLLSKYDFILKIAEKLSLEKTPIKECRLPEDQDLTLFPADQLLCFNEGMEILKNEYNNRRL